MKETIGIILWLTLILSGCPGKLPPDTDAQLNWQAPTTNVDGTPFDDFSHYTVYQGTDPEFFDTEYTTELTQYLVEGLSPETIYYFMVTVWDETGNESGPSNVVEWPVEDSDAPE